LIGGTKGSHFLTSHRGLREALNGDGVYAEAADGRPVFILPFEQYSLVGTTDLPFDGDPSSAIADADELEYLRKAVTTVFPSIALSPADVVMHYSGVRPLPFVDAHSVKPGAITRRHRVVETAAAAPIFSAIGGKLTTCRSFAEEIAAQVLRRLGLPIRGTSRDRVFPGEELYRRDAEALAAEPVRGTQFPRSWVRRVLREEWVTHLHDLVERRLMLQYEPSLDIGTLRDLAALMAEEHLLSPERIDDEVALCVARLEHRHGKRLSNEP